MKREEIVSQSENVVSGTPVFAGTRVPIESLIQHLKAGDSIDRFLQSFPGVSRRQVQGFLDLVLEIALKEQKDAHPA